MLKYPTPHLTKLQACLRNGSIPIADKPKINEAIAKYREWIKNMGVLLAKFRSDSDRLRDRVACVACA